MNDKRIAIIAGLILAGLICIVLVLAAQGSAATITVDKNGNGDHTTIQGAIENATDGDTIRIYAGTYPGNVLVNKTLTIIGNGSATTILDGDGDGDVMKITGDDVNISSLQCRNSGPSGTESGIEVQSDNVTIESCELNGNRYGVYLKSTRNATVLNSTFRNNEKGVRLYFKSKYSIIENCTFEKNIRGVEIVLNSDVNSILNNTFAKNEVGILLWGSHYSTLAGNTLSNGGIMLQPLNDTDSKSLEWMIHTIGTENTVNGDPVRYLLNETDSTISGPSGQVILVNCSNVTIKDHTIADAGVGIFIGHSPDTVVDNMTVRDHLHQGIRILHSEGVTISDSHVSGNSIGIMVEGSSSNGEITDCEIMENDLFGIDASGNQGTAVDASDSWWGYVSGPYHKKNHTSGRGDEVSDSVTYDPWIDFPPMQGYEEPLANIDSIDPGDAVEGEDITFSATGTPEDTVELFIWSSSIDGIFYNGTESVSTPFASFEGFETIASLGSTSGDARWVLTEETSQEGNVSIRSGAVDNNEESWIEMLFLGPGTLDFYWKVSSEDGFDDLIVSMDGKDQEKINGEVDWTKASLDISTGEHVIRWTYEKDGNFFEGDDRGWLDAISFSPDRILSNGTHSISLMVIDRYGVVSESVTGNLSINGIPVASIQSIDPEQALDTDTITFTGKGTDDGTIVRYAWRSTLDGEFYNGTEASFSTDSLFNGTHRIYLKVLDENGTWSQEVRRDLKINGKPRVGMDPITPSPALDVETITFSATANDDGAVVLYVWTSDRDGEFYNGTESEFEYTELTNGTHHITVQVQDDEGEWSDIAEADLSINGKPVAQLRSITPAWSLEGDGVTMNGSGTDDGEIIRYVWVSSADGELYNGTDTDYFTMALSNGTHTISFLVLDNNGTWSDPVVGTLTINGRPVATINMIDPTFTLDGELVTFNGSGTDDGTIVRYAWRSTLDGEFVNGTDAEVTSDSLSNGTHLISLAVMDNSGTWSFEDSGELTINGKPIAVIDLIDPNPALDIDSITFTANGTDDGNITTYSWSSSLDGEFYNGPLGTIEYGNLSNGTHTITLRILDNNGTWSEGISRQVIVNGRPVASIGSIGPNPALDRDAISFTGSGTDDGSVARYVWISSIDGTVHDSTSGNFQSGDLSNGTHLMTFRVRDNDGVWSADVTQELIINGVPIVKIISIDPDPALDIDLVTFTGTGSDDGNITTYVWTSSIDGEIHNGSNPSFTANWLSNGTHVIRYRCQDDHREWSDVVEATLDINGKPRAYIDTISPNPALNIDTITFNASAIDDGSVARYVWSSSLDGEIYNGTDNSFTSDLISNGTHLITLIVLDDNGTWSEEVSMELRVKGKPVAMIESVTPSPALNIDTITFTGLANDDGEIVRYVWESDIDGVFYDDTENSFDHRGLSNGSHVITFRVQDEDDEWSDDVSVMLDINGKPVAMVDSVTPNPALDTDEVTLVGIGNDDGTIIAYRWNSSRDGLLANGTDDTIITSDLSNGTHLISLAVQDDEGVWSEEAFVIMSVHGVPRVMIDSARPNPAHDDELIRFSGTVDDDEGIARYVWRSDRDGEFYNGTDASFNYTGLSIDSHFIYFRVLDDQGIWSDEVWYHLTVNGRPEAEIIQITPNPAPVETIVRFTGSGSDETAIVRYIWYSSLKGEIYNGTEETFETDLLYLGNHTISLYVMDDEGGISHPATMEIRVHSMPVAIITEATPSEGDWGTLRSFTGLGLDDSDIIRYQWVSDLDGILYDGDEPSFSTSALSNGTHEIFLTVVDSDGVWSDPAHIFIKVTGRPTAWIDLIEPKNAKELDPVRFVAGVYDDGTTFRYIWNSSIDGTFYDNASSEFYYNGLSIGLHTITLVVVDEEGLYSYVVTDFLQVFEEPVVTIGSISKNSSLEGEELLFTGNATDAVNITAYLWRSSIDGVFVNDSSPSVAYSGLSNGTHTIYLKVQNKYGVWSLEVSTSIRVWGKPVAVIDSISPDPGTEGEQITFTGHGVADDDIVEYYWRSLIDGILYQGPSGTITLTNLSVGDHTILFDVMTAQGYWSNSAQGTVLVKVANEKPEVTLDSPVVSSTVDGNVKIRGTASDVDGAIAWVEISIDDSNWTTVTGEESWSHTWDSNEVINGIHYIKVRSFDGVLYSDNVEISIMVENEDEENPILMAILLGALILVIIIGLVLFMLIGKKGAGPDTVDEKKEKDTNPEPLTPEDPAPSPIQPTEKTPDAEVEGTAPKATPWKMDANGPDTAGETGSGDMPPTSDAGETEDLTGVAKSLMKDVGETQRPKTE